VSDTSDTGSALHLDVIGAGPAYTDREGATGAAYLVRHGSTAVCLDLGQGAFTRLARALEPSRLSAVIVSHLHPDHFIDLVPLRHYLRWEFTPSRRVRVIGPRSLDDRLDGLHAQTGFTADALDVEVLEPGTRAVGSLTVAAARITHTADSYGFRVAVERDPEAGDAGPGLVYSGDCGRAEDLDTLIVPGDVLLSEVSFGPGPIVPGAGHLDGPAVGRLAARTGVGRVLLTHLQMGFDPGATIDSVRDHYDGPVQLVVPGDAFVIA
jgi:ribonuclease BN (tRNA processing enzyme)